MKTLYALGYHNSIHSHFENSSLVPARITCQFKDRYFVCADQAVMPAEITGKLRFSAISSIDLPVVGDWVAIAILEDLAIIHEILPRKSIIARKAIDAYGQKQPIAANIDYAMIVQAVDRDFNINRLERYTAIAYAEQIEPIVVLNKTDLISESELKEKIGMIEKRIGKINIFSTSVHNPEAIAELKKQFKFGHTYCMLGSSGVGKSSLINAMTNQQLMDVNAISTSTGKGKHTTTHRELIVLESGGVIIDNPGIREVGITDTEEGIEMTFSKISELANSCRYADCKHLNEPGCAILQAIEQGTMDEASYSNYQKIVRESTHYNMSIEQKRQKDRQFGKMVKQVMNAKRRFK